MITTARERNQKYLENSFKYHAPTPDSLPRYEAIRAEGRQFAALLLDLLPESRERSLALTAIEEAVMWANASVARNGDRLPRITLADGTISPADPAPAEKEPATAAASV